MAADLEMVTVLVKAGHEPSIGSSSSSERSEPPNEGRVQIPRAWLMTLQWFEAKLERWQNEQETPIVTLEIPGECDAEAGAKLLQRRTRYLFNPTGDVFGRQGSRSTRTFWWWGATGGRLRALSAALHIFHLTMLEDWAKEVIGALARYRFPCSESISAITADLKMDGIYSVPIATPLDVPLQLLKEMVNDACRSVSEHANHSENGSSIEDCERCKGLMRLADRALMASVPSSHIVKTLMGAWFNCFKLSLPDCEDPAVATNMNPTLGVEAKHSSRTWLSTQLESLVRRRVDSLVDICAEVRARFPLQRSVRVKRTAFANMLGEPYFEELPVALDANFTKAVFEILRKCFTVLFVKSALEPDLADEIGQVVSATIPSTVAIQFLHSSRYSNGIFVMPHLASVLPVASLGVQTVVLESVPLEHFDACAGMAHAVHPRARHLFLGKGSKLKTFDVKFLAKTSFPGLEGSPADTEELPTKKAKTA